MTFEIIKEEDKDLGTWWTIVKDGYIFDERYTLEISNKQELLELYKCLKKALEIEKIEETE